MAQMYERGMEIGPIASYNGWKKLGRQVNKGEKAIALWMPFTKKSKTEEEGGKEDSRTFFTMRNNWFSYHQTSPIEGVEQADLTPVTPEWNRAAALANLGITEVAFDSVNGNSQGFARPKLKQIAINPIAAMPWKTTFHEMAHCLLHGEVEELADASILTKDIKEAEAESVAFLCCAALGLPGLEESRGYVQTWLQLGQGAEEFAKKSAARVFGAADKILKAGTKASDDAGEAGHE